MEFNVESGDDGRTKAVAVTGPGGAAPLVRAHVCVLKRPRPICLWHPWSVEVAVTFLALSLTWCRCCWVHNSSHRLHSRCRAAATVVARAAAAVASAAVATATVIIFCLKLAGSIRPACTLLHPTEL